MSERRDARRRNQATSPWLELPRLPLVFVLALVGFLVVYVALGPADRFGASIAAFYWLVVWALHEWAR